MLRPVGVEDDERVIAGQSRCRGRVIRVGVDPDVEIAELHTPYGHQELIVREALGLGDDGGMRVGLAPYTSDADVDLLLESLTDWLRR